MVEGNQGPIEIETRVWMESADLMVRNSPTDDCETSTFRSRYSDFRFDCID